MDQQQALDRSASTSAGVPQVHGPESGWSAGWMLVASGASAFTV
jgi:hypothetical protein